MTSENSETADLFKIEILEAGAIFVPSLGLYYQYPFSFWQIDSLRKVSESHAFLDISIKLNPKSRTGVEVSMGLRFFNKGKGLCEEYLGMLSMEPACSKVEKEEDGTQYAVKVLDIDALLTFAHAMDAYEQEDLRGRFEWIPVDALKPKDQVSKGKRYTTQYRFWRGFAEFLKYSQLSCGDPTNQLDGGIISKPMMYLVFMYYLQNMLLTKTYMTSPAAVWAKVLETRNMIVNNFKPIPGKENDTPESYGDPVNIMFNYGPPFKGDFPSDGTPILKNLSSYHGSFFNGVLLKKPEFFENYKSFWAKTFPSKDVPPVPFPDDE